MNEPSLTAIVLTRDESPHIRRCLESLKGVAQRVCVVDSGSQDDTLEIARSMGADVFSNAWINYAAQFNWALTHGRISTDWVLRLDADEYLEPQLQSELKCRLPTLPVNICGVLLKRKYFFLGRWVRRGGLYPLFHLRVWRSGAASIESRWMDEHAVLHSGESIRFHGALVDDNRRDLAWWSQKHIGYATREAVQVLLEDLRAIAPLTHAISAGWQASAKRWVKQNIYNSLPLGVGPLLYVMYRLFLRFGFLDGPRGIAYHLLQGFWYRLVVDIRRYELGRAIEGLSSTEAKYAELERLTGLPLSAFHDPQSGQRATDVSLNAVPPSRSSQA